MSDSFGKEEAKKFMFENEYDQKQDEEWIKDNLFAMILDDEKEINKPTNNIHASHDNSQLLHQFNSFGEEPKRETQSLIDQAFDSIGMSHQMGNSQLQFPEPQNEDDNSSKSKFHWKSNPIPNYNSSQYIHEFNSTPNAAYDYYQPSYSPFAQFDEMAFQAQNNSPYNSPDNYNRVYNEPYYQRNQKDTIQFPEPDPTAMYNANNGIFAAFDNQEQANPFNNMGGHERIKFPSTSNMMSTNNSSSNMQQFAAHPHWEFSQASRISCPIRLQSKSKLEYKQTEPLPKFKSGEATKSSFLKALETRLEDMNNDVVIADILGKAKLHEVVKSQKGSRFVQEVYHSISEEEKEQVLTEIKEWWRDLMTDKFGNYVIQKIFEHGPEAHAEYFGRRLKGSMMSLSMDDHGCRVIQKLLENLKSETRIELVFELYGNVEKLLYNRNGNHVIQKCIEFVPEKHLDFIIEELSENIYAFCKHKYGCRVVGKLIEFWKTEEVDNIVEEILPNINELTFDASGNYVVQSILMHGKTVHKKKILSMFKKDLLKYSTHKYASNVIECLFKYWSNSLRKEIVKELLKGSKTSACPLEKMLKDKFGNYVIQKILDKIDESDRNVMIAKILEITKNRKQINNSAKHVLKIIKDKYL